MKFSMFKSCYLTAIGDEGIRTPDPLLAGQVLSQLSYTPVQKVPLSQGIRTPDPRLYVGESVRILGHLPAGLSSRTLFMQVRCSPN